MSTLIIGDFRAKQLFQYQTKSSDIKFNYNYFISEGAELTWFSANIKSQLAINGMSSGNVIIALGFNDCVYSAVWSSFKIEDLINDYTITLGELTNNFPSTNFYMCSIAPIEADYPFSEYQSGYIPLDVLSEKIVLFNSSIKSVCKDLGITFIDCYEYLMATGFATYDGVRYRASTSKYILEYLSNYVSSVAGAHSFVPRFVAPDLNTTDNSEVALDSSISRAFWINQKHGGESKYIEIDDSTGATIPNCTGYAWGRFYEILGSRPTLCKSYDETHNAEYWYEDDEDGYTHGDESAKPALGAVMCWRKGALGDDSSVSGSDAGHVAIIEQIDYNNDGSIKSIITSESGYDSEVFWLTKRTINSSIRVEYKNGKLVESGQLRKYSSNNWGASDPYIFQGFIYNPAISDGRHIVVGTVDKSQVTSGNYWLKLDSEEIHINARYIWQYFYNKGWTLNAVAGMLGNMQTESHINPGIWQDTREGIGPAFGLVQWDPFTKYTNWCEKRDLDPADMDSALLRIEWELENGQQYYSTSEYPLSFREFTKSSLPAEELGKAFILNYERPLDQSQSAQNTRGRQAKYWYEYLLNYSATSGNVFSIKALKADRVMPSSVSISSIVCNAQKVTYSIFKNSTNTLVSDPQIFLIDESAQPMATLVHEFASLCPNTEYKVIVEAISSDSESVIIEQETTFFTPQDYPQEAQSVSLICNDSIKSKNSVFTLTAKSPDYLSYWSSGCKYNKQLFVNGKLVKTKVEEVRDISESFTIKDEFDYDCKTGDIIQVGIQVWTKNDDNKVLYNNNSDTAKMSNPICLLNKPVIAYLNIN